MSGCILWTGYTVKSNGRDSHRYGRLSVNGRKVLAHRHVYEKARGPIPPGMHVLHRCDNPRCVNVEHLFLGTHAENMADMKAKGRATKRAPAPMLGASNPRTKLSAAQVLAIRSRRAVGEPLSALAAAFGVHHSHISRIASGNRR